MKFTLVIVLLLATCEARPQQINWSTTSNWTLYNIHDDNAFSYPVDTLTRFKALPLNDSVIHAFLKNAKVWEKEKTSLWMGLYVTSCRLSDGSLRKIDVSVYGGFFYDERERQYYEIPIEVRDKWLGYLNDAMARLWKPEN